MKADSALVHWPEQRAYECLGCGAQIEIPVEVRTNPEKFMIWREELEEEHRPCTAKMRAK